MELVARASFQPIALHLMFAFQMPNHRLDRRTPIHPAGQTLRQMPPFARPDLNLGPLLCAVSPIAQVHKRRQRCAPAQPLHLSQRLPQGVSVVRIGYYGCYNKRCASVV